MKKTKLLFFLSVLTGTTIYVSCRKMDRQDDKPSLSDVESRFFTEHTSGNQLVQAIRQFVKGENDKYHFADKLVKQIGYPYWDKSIITSGKGIIGGRGASDSSSTVYIPFVVGNQNVVNTSLVITATPTDTSFQFLCDWQYQNRINGSMNVDTTAENLAALFMLHDKDVFGYTRFKITDSSLLGNYPVQPTASGREIRINNNSNLAGRGNRTQLSVQVCYYTYYCGTVNYCNNLGGAIIWTVQPAYAI